MPKAAGKWNTMEITAKGRHSRWCSTARRPSTSVTASFDEGHFALQFGAGTMKFRKVEVKQL